MDNSSNDSEEAAPPRLEVPQALELDDLICPDRSVAGLFVPIRYPRQRFLTGDQRCIHGEQRTTLVYALLGSHGLD